MEKDNEELDDLIQRVTRRDARRIPLRLNAQTVILVAERNNNEEYRKKKAHQLCGEKVTSTRVQNPRENAEPAVRRAVDADELLRLRDECGKKWKDISTEMGVPTSTLLNRYKMLKRKC